MCGGHSPDAFLWMVVRVRVCSSHLRVVTRIPQLDVVLVHNDNIRPEWSMPYRGGSSGAGHGYIDLVC
jgi:hypothetical protein